MHWVSHVAEVKEQSSFRNLQSPFLILAFIAASLHSGFLPLRSYGKIKILTLPVSSILLSEKLSRGAYPIII